MERRKLQREVYVARPETQHMPSLTPADLETADRLKQRYAKFRAYGQFSEQPATENEKASEPPGEKVSQRPRENMNEQVEELNP